MNPIGVTQRKRRTNVRLFFFIVPDDGYLPSVSFPYAFDLVSPRRRHPLVPPRRAGSHHGLRGCRRAGVEHELSLLYYPFYRPGKTHYDSIRYFHLFLSDNQPFVSHRFHESHEERIAALAFASRLQTLGKADSRERSDASLCEICVICVKINHLT